MIPRSEIAHWQAREAEERLAVHASGNRKTADEHRATADRYADAIQGAEDAAREEKKLGLKER